MPDAITILHISDMQFGKFHRFAEENGDPPNPRDTLTARLIDDLKHLAEHNQLSPDLIICTGDLAEWGMPKEFTDAFKFLGELCDHYSLPRSRCIVIPGNHDINRSNCEAYFIGCKGDGEEPEFPWFPKWKHYKSAFDSFYTSIPGITFNTETPWSLFVNEDLRVVVAGLNSTMDEGHDDAVNAQSDKGHHGLCTEPQIHWFKERITEQQFDGWLRIGAVHHNTIRGCRRDDENLRDADLLGNMLGDHLHLLLHGHTHEAKADILASQVRVYSTGSASLKTGTENAPVPTDIPNQYQFVVIEGQSITRYCRQYAPGNTPPEFIGDVRQSPSRGDWIIKDDVDLSDVSGFVDKVKGKAEPAAGGEDKPSDPQPVRVIPTAPDFYAEPDFIGSHQFVGRDSQLQELDDWAKPADPTNLLLFEAIGGNGKSMLTWEWVTNSNHATQVRADWAGRFWYSFYERGAIMADFCQRALAYMTGQPLKELRKKKTAELKEPLLAQLHAKPWLLILDGLERVLVAYHRIDAAEMPDEDANSPTDKIVNRDPRDAIREEDNDLLRALAAATPSKILVSSRLTPRVLLNPSGQPITGAKRITLPGLRPSDAERLLRSCDIKGDNDAIQSYLTTNCDNHPLVIGILGGLIHNYLPARGNFDAWMTDPDGGARLDLASLDLIQRRNHILRAALDALPPASRQLLSTLALLSESVDYETLCAFNPHLPPEPEKPAKTKPPWRDKRRKRWEEKSDEEKAEAQKNYEAALARWTDYEMAVHARLTSVEYCEAPSNLTATVLDLEQRGLLQYDGRTRRHDLHPVVRGVAAGGIQAEAKQRYGQRVVDYFSAQSRDPYEQADSLEDLSAGMHIVRTLFKMGRYGQAFAAFNGGLSTAMQYRLEADAEILSLLRPFFPDGWGTLSAHLSTMNAFGLAVLANHKLRAIGQVDEAIEAGGAVVLRAIDEQDRFALVGILVSIASSCSVQNRLQKEEQCRLLALELVDERRESVQLGRSHHLSKMGRLEDSSVFSVTRTHKSATGTHNIEALAGRHNAFFLFWNGALNEHKLAHAEKLAKGARNRHTLRDLVGLRAQWKLEQEEWALAEVSFAEAVRMARESGIPDAESETGLALAKHHLGQLAESQREAERLAELRKPAHRLLAQLWLALGDPAQAKHHALAAYRWACADGEPYVHRYELTKTTELLQQMNVPIPNLPPYDPAKDEPFPWEGDVRAAIEKLRAEKKAEEG